MKFVKVNHLVFGKPLVQRGPSLKKEALLLQKSLHPASTSFEIVVRYVFHTCHGLSPDAQHVHCQCIAIVAHFHRIAK